MRFTGICIITENLLAMREFYMKVLRTDGRLDEDYAEFFINGLKLSIFSRDAMENMAPGCMKDTGAGSCVIEFQVNDVDAEYELLKVKKVKFVKLPTTQPWGTRSVWFKDPDGNIINFFSNVK